ncbi:uncharacterized protein LOC132195677 [Neocloeon triangulifer]|uniref:uncharacterized protein LOC132195677 n=1 Tax=Neocloeon triangulifer TaxID=2078957 RepID=UPI00286EF41C|nr:uncharacterized protein LOC132195677 [Neocloeon triangulifer]
MPLFAKLLLLILLVAVQVHQDNSAIERRAFSKKNAGKRPQIIKCCGLKRCSVAIGQAKTRSKNTQIMGANSTTRSRETSTTITSLGELTSTQTDISDKTSDFLNSPLSTKGDMQTSNTIDAQIPEISTTSEIPELVPTAKPSADMETTTSSFVATSEPNIGTETITETRIPPKLSTQLSESSDTTLKADSTLITDSSALTTLSTTKAIEKTSTKMATTTTTIDPALVGKCKTETNAAVNRSLFLTNGELADPDLHGFWLNACGQTFLLGKALGTWHENSDKCFSLKMQPFGIESREKLECMKTQAKGWKFNMNYWTGGARDLTSGTFGWCSAHGPTPWQDVLPLVNLNKDKNCVQMQINKTSGSVSISERRCSDKTIYACQGPPTKGPKCTSPVCPNVTCQRDPQLFTTSPGDKSTILKNHSLHGKWFLHKLRNYLFSFENDTRTYLEATKACCALGMSLLSLDGQHKYDAMAIISNTTEMIKELQNLTFWTSGSDEGCESVFGFCSAKRLFRGEEKWLPGQPDNAGRKENHVAVHIWRQKGQVLLADYDGIKKFRYVCEQRRNPLSKNGKQAIIDECSLIYNVNSTEIDLLQNATKLDLRMKCFLQCVGDAVGLLVGGKFVASEVFAMLESMNFQNAADLMKNMAIMDECNNKTYGMDECDKAYQLTKCARDKAPAVFDQMITNLDNLTSDSLEVSSRSSGCVYCNVDMAARSNLSLINITMNASSCMGFTNGTQICKCSDSKMYIIFFSNYFTFPYVEAVKKCCEYGMRLVSPLNYAKAMNCIRVLLANGNYGPRCWAVTNAMLVDVTSGLSFDCESQTSFFPQKLNPSQKQMFDPNKAYDGGPLAVFLSHYSGRPEFSPASVNDINPFICEAF